MNNRKIITNNLTILSISHALIDATCLAVVFGIFGLNILEFKTNLYLVVIYNIIAFALQAPFGYLIDKYKIPTFSILLGFFLTAVSTLSLKIPLLAVTTAGLGNALFHVAGGIFTLNLNFKKATFPGIYVAPGALGLFLGVIIGKQGYFLAWPFIILLSLFAFLTWKIQKPKINYKTNINPKAKLIEISILLLLLSIAVRGLVGLSLALPWKENIIQAIILTFFIINFFNISNWKITIYFNIFSGNYYYFYRS